MELDEKLRARLHALSQDEQGLDERARARVRARVLEAARAPGRRAVIAWLALPALAALAGWLWLGDVPPESTVTQREASREHGPQPAAARDAELPECATDLDAAPGEHVVGAAVESSLELPRARVVKLRSSQLEVAAFDRCDLGLALAQGEVAVHARSLRGGRLWIDTPLGRTEVRGTVFSLAVQANRLRIAVAEGSVALRRGALQLGQIAANEVLAIDARGAISRAVLGEHERARLLARLGLGPEPVRLEPTGEQPPARETGTDAARAEERLWREGAIPAFTPEERDTPSSVQPDGRPMKKPRLVE